MAGAVGVIPAAGPQPGPAPYGGAHAPVQPAVDLHKQLPGLLGDFISRLPPARSLQGLHPDVDQVRDQRVHCSMPAMGRVIDQGLVSCCWGVVQYCSCHKVQPGLNGLPAAAADLS